MRHHADGFHLFHVKQLSAQRFGEVVGFLGEVFNYYKHILVYTARYGTVRYGGYLTSLISWSVSKYSTPSSASVSIPIVTDTVRMVSVTMLLKTAVLAN